MKVVLAKSGPGVAAPPFLRAVLAIDVLVWPALGLAAFLGWVPPPWGAGGPTSPPVAWWIAGYAAIAVATDLLAARLSPAGLAWRRRAGFLAILGLVWRGSPFQVTRADPFAGLLVLLWTGVVWVALVTGGRALSRAIASVTGEDKPE